MFSIILISEVKVLNKNEKNEFIAFNRNDFEWPEKWAYFE